MADGKEHRLLTACTHDVPDLIALARESLATLTYLHSAEKGRTQQRFGQGMSPRDNYLPIVRDGSDAGPHQ